jgi:hypothetical protein
MRPLRLVTFALLVTAFSRLPLPAADNAVLFWNEQALNATRLARQPPPVIALHLGTFHAAIADAVDGIAGQWQPWLVTEKAPAGANIDAAIASAAYTVLNAIWGQASNPHNFQVAYDTSLAAIPDGQSKTDGIEWGKHVAQLVLADRAKSGFGTPVKYTAGTKPGEWRETAPEFRAAATPQLGRTKPFVMESAEQFRGPPPPAVESKEFADALNQVAKVGGRDDADRTDYQTQSVPFWSDGLGTSGPAGHWNMIAQGLAKDRKLSEIETARLFALLNFAAADAFISAWDTKFFYNTARPETEIREITKDTNPYIEQRANWIPNMASLPFPSYPSAHMTFTAAATRVLALYFGADDVMFSTTSDGLPGAVRTFHKLSDASEEVGMSRIYGGIHTKFDVTAGKDVGARIGDWVFAHALRPTS